MHAAALPNRLYNVTASRVPPSPIRRFATMLCLGMDMGCIFFGALRRLHQRRLRVQPCESLQSTSASSGLLVLDAGTDIRRCVV